MSTVEFVTPEFVPLPLEGLVLPEPELVVITDVPDVPELEAPAAAAGTVTATVGHVDAGSVLRLSLAFYTCAWVVLVIAATILWAAAAAVGVIGNIEHFMRDIGFAGFRFRPGLMIASGAFAGLVLVGAGTVANMLAAMLYNLLSHTVGGIKLTVDRDDLVAQPRSV